MNSLLVGSPDESSKVAYVNGGSAITAGSVVALAGGGFGVALSAIATDETGTLYTRGRFRVTKASGTALAQGKAVGWDAGNTRVNMTDISGGKFGEVATAALSGDTSVEVNIGVPRRVFSKIHTPSSAEASANACVIDTGFGNVPTGGVQVEIRVAADGTTYATGKAITLLTGADAGKVSVAATDIVVGHAIHLTAHE